MGAGAGSARLRLLLDEMYPAAIAQQLRRRGHEVDAVTERPELRALSDDALFAGAHEWRCAMVTENVADFIPLADAAEQRGRPHYGLVLVDPARYPRGHPRTIGRIVTALELALAEYPGQEPISVRHWL